MHDLNCTRCGECCRSDTAEIMIYENLTKEQKKEVYRPRTEGVCCMLEDNLCGIEVRFGHEAKPDICKNAKCKKEKK